MIDLRPIGYIIGLLVAFLGISMLVPLVLDLAVGNGAGDTFFQSAAITILTGGLLALACANGMGERLTLQQTFLLTSSVWLALPIFGALPFVFGATDAAPVDAFFEAMSGLTTTGATVFNGLDDLPQGLLLWRAMMQWFGGIGIVVVAMVFLPELRIGGMQIFKSEAFDTFGKILPRAGEIAQQISVIYISLTIICALVYAALGMGVFDSICHAMTTVSTGGFANYDTSFGHFPPRMEYFASIFMILSALPFVRYVQLLGGAAQPVFRDTQVRGFFVVLFSTIAILTLWQVFTADDHPEENFRESLFNAVSILSGTGYSSADYSLWGSLPVVVFFFIGLIGGCAGSTACSVKIFRYQILVSAIRAQVNRIHSPNGVFSVKFDGRRVSDDILSSVMAFFMIFIVSLGLVAVALGMTGLDFVTSISGAATALANVGPGLGDIIGPSGNFAPLPHPAKWILIAAMFVGRLELMVVLAVFTRRFWQA